MIDDSALDKRKNKQLIVNNQDVLKRYAIKNYELFGKGIVVINLFLLKTDSLQKLDTINSELENTQEPAVYQPVSYIPQGSFWFKIIELKIKKKYQIDIQEQGDLPDKLLIVLIKDDSIEHFSIYSIKTNSIK